MAPKRPDAAPPGTADVAHLLPPGLNAAFAGGANRIRQAPCGGLGIAQPWWGEPVWRLVDRRRRSRRHASPADFEWRRGSPSPGSLCEGAMGTSFGSALGSARASCALKVPSAKLTRARPVTLTG